MGHREDVFPRRQSKPRTRVDGASYETWPDDTSGSALPATLAWGGQAYKTSKDSRDGPLGQGVPIPESASMARLPRTAMSHRSDSSQLPLRTATTAERHESLRYAFVITTGLSRFVPSVRPARKGQTTKLHGWFESAPTVESEFCSNPNVMLRRGGKVKHGVLSARPIVCGDRHSCARDFNQRSLRSPGSQSAAHDLRPASGRVLRRLGNPTKRLKMAETSGLRSVSARPRRDPTVTQGRR
jgi:hypothetical protein